MENEIKVLLDKNERQDEKLQNITNQLDLDRRDIDHIRVKMGTIEDQMTALINQMIDFKKEIRQEVADVLKQELPSAVKKAVDARLNIISRTQPKKVFEKRIGIIEQIKLLFTKKK